MISKPTFVTPFVMFLLCLQAFGQRTYKANSVLATGVWGKISVKEPGVYKVDVNLLSGLGFNTSNLSSITIRLYGNGGGLLSEANSEIPVDDLQENPNPCS